MIKDSISEMIANGATRTEIMNAVEKEMKAAEEAKAKVQEANKREAHKEDIIAILNHFDNIMVREGVMSEDERGSFADSPIVDIMIDTAIQSGKEARAMMDMIDSVPRPRGMRATVKPMDENGSIDDAIKGFLRTL